jgi:uncharacterized repeat protein (TIGR01451 family)
VKGWPKRAENARQLKSSRAMLLVIARQSKMKTIRLALFIWGAIYITALSRVTHAAVPTISIGDVALFEGNASTTNAGFIVTLSSTSETPVSVNYATANDTALANTDYVPTNSTLTFAPGITNLTIDVLVNGDTVEEQSETFLLQLSNPINATLQDALGVGLILNDDNVAGKLDHFSWEEIPSIQTVLKPFATAITARDVLGDVVPGFNGTVELSALSSASRASTILISEVDTGSDQVEFANVSSQAVDVSLWQVAIYDSLAWPLPKTVFTFPSGTSVSAGGIFTLREGGTAPGVYPGFALGLTIGWNDLPGGNPVAIALLDRGGGVVDFFEAGTADRARITVPALVQATDWIGAPLPSNTNPTQTYQRKGAINHRGAQDWVAFPRSLGNLNSAMRVPFEDSKVLPVSPVTANGFLNGTWRGEVSILQFTSNAVLRVDDGNGHHGEANPIALSLSNDLTITIEGPAFATALKPFSVSLVVSNSGPDVSSDVVLTNPLPTNTRFSAGSVSQGTIFETNSAVVAIIGSVNSGQQVQIDLTLIPEALGFITNVATVAKHEAEPRPENNVATARIEVGIECAGMPQGAIGWWSGDGDAVDRFGGNNGLLENGVKFESGKVGLGFSLDGIDDEILVSDSPSLAIRAGEDFSVEGWIKIPVGAPNPAVIFDKRQSPDVLTSMGILLFVNNGRLAAQMGDAPIAPNQFSTFVSPNPELRDGLFHHVALSIVRNFENGGKLYVDGQVVFTFNPTVEPGDLSNSAPLRIGHGANPIVPAAFKGVIDELVFYRRALSAAEIAEVYQAGDRGRCSDDLTLLTLGLDGRQSFVGEAVSFQLTVANFGTTAATQVHLTNTLSSNMRLVSAASSRGAVVRSGNSISVDFGDIPAGTNATVTISGISLEAGFGTNIAYVTRFEDEQNLLNNRSVATFSIQADCLSLPENSSLWSAEGNANDENGRNNGTLQGGTTYVTGKVGRAFHFDGVDDGVAVASSSSLNFVAGEDLSLEAWIRWEAGPSQQIYSIMDKRLVPKTAPQNIATGYALIIYDGSLGCELGTQPERPDNYANFISTGPNLLDGAFHHVAVTVDRDSSTGGRLYVDGAQIMVFDPRSQSGDLSIDEPLLIGKGANPIVNTYFRGVIDEAAVHRRSLLAEEIQGIYKMGARGYCPVSPTADRDSDGLPDLWEAANGLNRADPSDANLDSDGDGLSNLSEYKAGTDPRDPTSALRLSLAEIVGTQVRVVFGSVAGLHYRIEQTPSVTIPDWFPVGEVVTGTGGAQEVQLQVDGNTRQQFYRVRLVTP